MSKIGAIQIVEKYLKENGFDGLYSDECGCELSDLAPCESMSDECHPGYKIKTPHGEDGGWQITTKKPAVPYSEKR